MKKVMIVMLFTAITSMLIGVYLVFNNGYPSGWDAVDKAGYAAQFQANALARNILPGYALILSGGITMIAIAVFLKK